MVTKAELHMRMDNPVNIRKLVLESAIDATRLQQHLKNLKKIRRQKLEQQKMFKQVIMEIKELFKNIEFESLPELPHNIPFMHNQQHHPAHPHQIHKKPVIQQPVQQPKTQQLPQQVIKQKPKDPFEHELDELNRKLDSLEF